MKGSLSFIRNGGWLTTTLAAIVGVFAVVATVQGATTISTSINTEGAIAASSTIIGSSTLSISGASVFHGALVLGDESGDTVLINGALTASSTAALSSTLSVSATSTLASTTVNRFLSVGSTTPTTHIQTALLLDGTATTTIQLATAGGATKGTCIQMETVAGANVRMYVNGTTLNIEAGTCL